MPARTPFPCRPRKKEEPVLKRPFWAAVTATAAAMVLATMPSPYNPVTGTALAAASDAVDPALNDKVASGGTVRVNVVTSQTSELSSAQTAGQTLVTYTTLPLVTLRVDRTGLTQLESQPGVVSVTEDVPVKATLNESTVKIGSDRANDAGKTGAGVSIAVLDTGVEKGHPFLGGRVKQEACFSVTDANYGATSLCPNSLQAQVGAGSADTATGPCSLLGTQCDHGTHVAGIAAGNANNAAGAPKRGVAPAADIAAVQVFTQFNDDSYCGAGGSPCVLSFTSSQIKGLEQVQQWKAAGVNIVAANMSLGGSRWTTGCDADPRKAIIDSLLTKGVATVIAAGNNGYTDAVSAPGCIASAVTVGSTTDTDEVSTFSNRGPLLDLLAPGTSINSSVTGGTYASKNGTSMATPHVAGALAVLRQTYPAETVESLVSLLATTGKPISYTGATTPRIDVYKAITAVTPAPDPTTKKPRTFHVDNDQTVVIPDGVGSPAPGPSVTSPITVAEYPGQASNKLSVSVNITHTYRGDVKLELLSPTGKVFLLKNSSVSDGADNIVAIYTVDASVEPANGMWKLRMTDVDDADTGKLNWWSLIFPTPFEKNANEVIADNSTLVSAIDVTNINGNAAGPLQVYVNMDHTKLGEARVLLASPDGRVYTLKPYGSEPGGSLVTTWGVDATDAVANGTWTLKVTDNATGDTGTLKGWALGFPSYENQTVKPIPDKNFEEIWTSVSSLVGTASSKVQVYVEVDHQRHADLKIDVIAPDGSIHLLKSSGAPTGGGIFKKVYTVNLDGKSVNGWWKLRVDDLTVGNTGTTKNFAVRF
ncbi:proprotein convertase P-domain-containing protein [Streptomyces griseus]|nr:proprotein convertase P-domain-containing protein [Streptomyces griseus]